MTSSTDYEAARVRMTSDHGAGNSRGAGRDFRTGEVVHVVRRGDPDMWWTSYDVDGAYALPDEKVEVLGRSYYWDPLPGSLAWNRASEEEREFWTHARSEGRAADAAERDAAAELRPVELQTIDRPDDYAGE